MGDFHVDLKTGHKAEEVVANLYRECGYKTSFSHGSGYDIYVPEPEFTTEVKFDIKEYETFNVAIEVRNSKLNKDSGILVSYSDIWAHVLKDSVWIINTSDLKDFIQQTKPTRVINRAGDGNAKIFLYPTYVLLSSFIRIDNVSPDYRREMIESRIGVF